MFSKEKEVDDELSSRLGFSFKRNLRVLMSSRSKLHLSFSCFLHLYVGRVEERKEKTGHGWWKRVRAF